jgi:hypothetical protein
MQRRCSVELWEDWAVMNWTEFRRKRQLTELRHYPGIRLEGPRKVMENFSQDAVLPDILRIQLTSWSWALLEKPPVVELLKNFPNISWNPEVHYHVHNSPILPILSQINALHTTPFYLRSILILSTHLSVVDWGTMLQTGRSRVRFQMRWISFQFI